MKPTMCKGRTSDERWAAALKEVSGSRETRQQTLQGAGILDTDGNLAPMYR